ncbi:MAG: Hint domain-containing protein [Pseudomonadota bacterium]
MPTSFKVFSLGVQALIDPTEGNENAENATALVGLTIGSSASPLHQEIKTFAPGTAGASGGSANIYDQNNNLSNDQFTIDGGSDQTYDAASAYTITINYADGGSASITGVILQDTSGNSYLLPQSSNNASQAAMEANAIESISIDALVQSSATGVAEDRMDGTYVVPDATIAGTAGDDVIDGSYTDLDGDNINDFDGDDDLIDAGAGNDTVDGGVGNDSIFGGTGNDSAIGGSGNDVILGEDGDDTASGGTGSDLIYGGAGDDSLSTGLGEDTLYGGAGDDQLSNSAGNDTLIGGTGNDTLIATLGDDQLYGGAGNDTLEGGQDDDVLYGGAGNDQLDGGTGNDLLFGGDGDDTLDGGSGNGNDLLYGGAGSDSFEVMLGGNTFYGGDDEDTFGVGFGTDTIYGGSGGTDLDTLSASVADDALTITLTGDESGTFSDSDGDSGSFVDVEAFELTSEDDSFDGSASDADQTVIAAGGQDTLTGGSGSDVFYAGDGADTIDGGDNGDTLYGGAGNDVIEAGEEINIGDDDLIYAGDGEDRITSAETDSRSDDRIYAGAGNDTITMSGGDNVLYGGTGRDTISGGQHEDTIFGGNDADDIGGGAGNDQIDGGAGNDQLDGGAGNDTLTGGAGSDVFVVSSGADTITDFSVGNDTLDLSGLTDVGNALTNQDGSVTADEIVVTQPGGPGTDQLLTFPSGESVSVSDGTINTASQQTQFASLVSMGVPPCFAPGTHILTEHGEKPVETLWPGDRIVTADHGLQTLRWIGRREVDFTDPQNTRGDKDKPVLIAQGALGGGLPGRDLVVSPLHRMALSGPDLISAFNSTEVLAIAKSLTKLPGVRIMAGRRRAVYYALLFERHEIIFAEGARTESFRPGPVALSAFQPEMRAQVFAIYPGLAADPEAALGPPARPIITKQQATSFICALKRASPDRLAASGDGLATARCMKGAGADLGDRARRLMPRKRLYLVQSNTKPCHRTRVD